MAPKVTVSLVTYKSERFLEGCLNSLFNQKFKDFELIVVENAPSGAEDEIISRYPVTARLTNSENLGFTRAHNQAILLGRGEYVLVLNQDIILDENFLGELVNVLDEKDNAASVTGKLLRALPGNEKIIDTTGLQINRSRRVIDRLADRVDFGQADSFEEVFGVSAAAALYRRRALDQIRFKDEFFDEQYFAYKEDVDLAWRLKLAGWLAYYQPRAFGRHYRGSGATASGLADNIRTFRKRGDLVTYNSYKNHIFTLVKNEQYQNFLTDGWRIIGHEIKKLGALFLLKPWQLPVWFEIFRQLPLMLQKRKFIQAKVKINPMEFREQWISQS